MKLHEVHSPKYQNIWYHGSPKNFDKFDPNATRANRGTNVSGVYITKDEDLAREYAGPNGYVYEVEHNTHNPFNESSSLLTDEMLEVYAVLISQHTAYKLEWAKSNLVPDAKANNKLKSDLDGDIKRKVYEAGGYDSYWFNDMGDMVLVVFDESDLTILNKFAPQALSKDNDSIT